MNFEQYFGFWAQVTKLDPKRFASAIPHIRNIFQNEKSYRGNIISKQQFNNLLLLLSNLITCTLQPDDENYFKSQTFYDLIMRLSPLQDEVF
jgi:hypothetical protein